MKHFFIYSFCLILCACCGREEPAKLSPANKTALSKTGHVNGVDTFKVLYTRLSDKYNFHTVFTCASDSKNDTAKNNLELLVLDKKTGKNLQNISLRLSPVYEAFREEETSRSLLTHYREKAEVADNDFGDLVVADLNFDHKEDIAVKYDNMGNGGPLYIYLLQQNDGSFKKDNFLTDTVCWFPSEIHAREKTIVNAVHANVCGFNRNEYAYKNGRWKFVKSKYVNICEQ